MRIWSCIPRWRLRGSMRQHAHTNGFNGWVLCFRNLKKSLLVKIVKHMASPHESNQATHGYIIDLQDWFHTISRFHSIFIPKGAIEVLQFMAILTSLGPTVATRGMAMAWINLAQLPQRSKRFLTILLLLFCLFFTLVYGFRGTVDISNIHQISVCVILCDHAWNMRPIHFSLHPLLPPGGKTRPVLSLMPVSVTRRRGHS